MQSKQQLKNKFLLQLEKHRAPESRSGYDAITVISSIDGGKLTEEEKDLALEGFEELKREGLIIQDPKQLHSPTITKITEKGQIHLMTLEVTNNLEIGSNYINIQDFVSDQQLLRACKTEFESGSSEGYWNAVNNAMRHFEVRVRSKAKLDATDIGFELMSKAFNISNGKLVIQAAKTDEERKGFLLVTMGIMKFHRNQKAHTEGKLTRTDALQIIGYIDYLLSVIETSAEERNH